jgi:hypothetical protein
VEGNAFEDLESRVASVAFLQDDHVVFVDGILVGNSHNHAQPPIPSSFDQQYPPLDAVVITVLCESCTLLRPLFFGGHFRPLRLILWLTSYLLRHKETSHYFSTCINYY